MVNLAQLRKEKYELLSGRIGDKTDTFDITRLCRDGHRRPRFESAGEKDEITNTSDTTRLCRVSISKA